MMVFRDIGKAYGAITVLEHFHYRFPAGCVTAVTGPNGAGKTTLLKIAASLLPPDTGQVEYDGVTAGDARQSTGYAAETPAVWPRLTPVEQCRVMAELYRCRGTALTEELFALFNLKQERRIPVDRLSAGTRQKVHLTLSLLHSPAILLLDEPFTGLDRDSCLRLIDWLKNGPLRGSVIVVTSHNYEYVNRLADDELELRGPENEREGSV